MGQDAVALLKISDLRLPRRSGVTVVPGEDCALVFTSDGFAHFTADEHAVRLRDALGKRFAAHDDARGIFFFPDVCEPSAETYEGIVRQVGKAGVWGSAARLVTKGSARVDRVLVTLAAERGLDRGWFVSRSRPKATRAERVELEDVVSDITNTIVDDRGGVSDESIVQELVESRVAAWVAGEPLRAKPPSRPRKQKPVTPPGEPGHDPDVAEMIRLFGGDEASWKDMLTTRRRPNHVTAERSPPPSSSTKKPKTRR